MKNKILDQKTNKALISMSVPISIGMLSTFLFQVVDTYFVGQLGADELAALSFSSTVYFLLVGLFIGLSVGVSIIIGKAAGASDIEKVRKTTLLAVLISLALSISLGAIGIVFIEEIFTFLGASGSIIPLIEAYTIPLLMGIPLLTVGLMIGGVLRATGNVTKPEVLMGAAGIINLIFDYALIFGKWGFPALGIKGAAYATVFSWVVVIIGMLILMISDQLLKLRTKAKESAKEIVKEIFSLGGPTIATQVVGPFTLMYITFLLARESELAVAAFGVASRIEMLLMIGILGVSTALTPFIAQNLGANKKDRINEAIAFGGRASTYLGILVTLLLFLFIKPIAGIFSENAEIINNTSNYFYIVSLSYVLYGLYIITTSIFNGLQLPLNSLKISLIKSFLFTVPLTFIGSFWGSAGIFIGLSLSNILAGIYASNRMRKEFKLVHSELEKVNVIEEYKRDFKKLFGKIS